jgi:excisionase family DNA binding protein
MGRTNQHPDETLARLLNRDEVAEILGLGGRTVDQLVAEGRLTPIRPTGRRAVRFSVAEVERLIAASRVPRHGVAS